MKKPVPPRDRSILRIITSAIGLFTAVYIIGYTAMEIPWKMLALVTGFTTFVGAIVIGRSPRTPEGKLDLIPIGETLLAIALALGVIFFYLWVNEPMSPRYIPPTNP